MKTKQLKLKEGEGLNTHLLTSKEEFAFKQLGEDSYIIELSSDLSVTHEEHGEIRIKSSKKNKLVSCSQSEYDPFANDYRQVFD